jgi:hypothetical protein
MFSSVFGNGPWFGATRLCNAAKNNDIVTLKALASPELVNQVGYLGWAPLHKGTHHPIQFQGLFFFSKEEKSVRPVVSTDSTPSS